MTAICYYIVIEQTPTLKTQHLCLFVFRPFVGYVRIFPRSGPRFELQLLTDRQEAARVVGRGMTDPHRWRGMWLKNTVEHN